MGITINALRVRMNRLRDKIERQVLDYATAAHQRTNYLVKKPGV